MAKTEDPKKKKKPSPPPTKAGTRGTGAEISRNKKGDLVAYYGPNYAGVSQKTLRQDRKTKAGTGDGTYSGVPAPKTNKVKLIAPSGPLKSASKKMIRQSRRKPTGSPQARRSQRRNRY